MGYPSPYSQFSHQLRLMSNGLGRICYTSPVATISCWPLPSSSGLQQRPQVRHLTTADIITLHVQSPAKRLFLGCLIHSCNRGHVHETYEKLFSGLCTYTMWSFDLFSILSSDTVYQLGLHSSRNIGQMAGGTCGKCFTKYHDWVDVTQCIYYTS